MLDLKKLNSLLSIIYKKGRSKSVLFLLSFCKHLVYQRFEFAVSIGIFQLT